MAREGRPGRCGRRRQKVGVALDSIRPDKREQVERFYDLFWHNPVESRQGPGGLPMPRKGRVRPSPGQSG
jgi:hypothetical protein